MTRNKEWIPLTLQWGRDAWAADGARVGINVGPAETTAGWVDRGCKRKSYVLPQPVVPLFVEPQGGPVSSQSCDENLVVGVDVTAQPRAEVAPLSSSTARVQHPAYRAIIALGPAVVPLLLP